MPKILYLCRCRKPRKAARASALRASVIRRSQEGAYRTPANALYSRIHIDEAPLPSSHFAVLHTRTVTMAAPQVLSTPELLSIILKHVHHEDRSRRARRNPPGDVSLAPFYMYQDRLTPFLAKVMLVDSIWFEVAADILWENAEINDRWKFITPIRQQIYASKITHLRFSPGATDSSIPDSSPAGASSAHVSGSSSASCCGDSGP